MRQSIEVSLALCTLLVGAAGQGLAAELKSVTDVGKAIEACWHPPVNSSDSSVTLRFGFKRDGSLLGPPQPTAVHVKGDDKARKVFVDAATKAVADCTPLGFSSELAKGMAGQVFALSFGPGGSTTLGPAR